MLTGRLEHDELAPLLAACEALVVPSTFPEAFGMVAAEAAACGALPVSAGHSGAGGGQRDAGGRGAGRGARGWLSFPVDDGAVRAIAERVRGVAGGARATLRARHARRARRHRARALLVGGRGRAASSPPPQGRLAELPPVA